MSIRMRVAAFCVAALALLGVGAVAGGGVFAQDSTPTTTETPAVGSSGDTTADSSADYDAFVAALAANLGISDPATVDAAIKTTLKQQVDDRLAAGEISANEATALKERIDAGDFGPFLFGIGGHKDGIGGPRGGQRGDGYDHQGRGDKGQQQVNGTGSGATPTETPTQGS
jgi:hypothetical protein